VKPEARRGRGRRDARGRLHRRREARRDDRERHARRRVGAEDRPRGVEGGEPRALEPLRRGAAGERAERRRDRSGELVPGERAGPAVRRELLRERGLLDGEERADLVAGRAQHADGGGDGEERERGRRRERQPGEHDERGPEHEHAPPPHAIRAGRDEEGDGDVAEEREGEEEADLRLADARRGEVQHEHDGREPVREEAQGARGEEEADVAARRRQG
jgi:hypothetical protein